MAETVLLNGERHIVTQCGSCGVWHTVPQVVWDTQRREGGFHHCPNGHSRGWKTGTEREDEERIRRERDILKQQIARIDGERRLAAERADRAEKEAARLRKRSQAGVCPCCNRSFVKLRRHMETKHPNVVPIEQKTA